MTTAAWSEMAVGLLGALIGASSVLLGARVDRRAAERRDRRELLERAVCRLIVQSELLDLRAHEAVTLAANAGGAPGAVARAIGAIAPTDLTELVELLTRTVERLHEAATEIEVHGDRDTAVAARRVSTTAASLVAAHHVVAVPSSVNFLRIAFTGKRFESRATAAAARADLDEAREALIAVATAVPGERSRFALIGRAWLK